MSTPGYAVVHCPDCASLMRLLAVDTAPNNKDEVTYRCEACAKEIKQQVEPKSLDWRS
jgi:DNA-directed RNA polymerase subunit RPC12/RpoP